MFEHDLPGAAACGDLDPRRAAGHQHLTAVAVGALGVELDQRVIGVVDGDRHRVLGRRTIQDELHHVVLPSGAAERRGACGKARIHGNGHARIGRSRAAHHIAGLAQIEPVIAIQVARIGGRATVDDVVAGPTGDRVQPAASEDLVSAGPAVDHVAARVAEHPILPRTPEDPVAAALTLDDVDALAAADQVVAGTTGDAVTPAETDDHIVARCAVDAIVALRADDRRRDALACGHILARRRADRDHSQRHERGDNRTERTNNHDFLQLGNDRHVRTTQAIVAVTGPPDGKPRTRRPRPTACRPPTTGPGEPDRP